MMFLMVYITILFCLESMSVAAGIWIVEEIYVNNRNYPGGPWAYFLATQNQPENVLFAVSTFLLTFLSDLLVVSLVTMRSRAFFIPPFSDMALLGYLEFFRKTRRLRGDSFSYSFASRICW